MKRIFSILISLMLVAMLFAGCNQPLSSKNDGTEKLSVVSTIFPGYDFTREVAGEQVELTMLLPPGGESHSFEPTPQDILKIQNCDVFIYVGGESDTWVDGILDSMDTSGMKILSMMDLVETVPEEIVAGMEEDHGHDHEIDPDDIHDRPLSDWTGSWSTIENALSSGAMDEYVAHQAEENEVDFATQKENYTKRWKSDYPTLEITGDGLTMGGKAVAYQYTGYRLVESDHGSSVWYGFEATDAVSDAPKYIAFSDHGTGGHEEEEHDEHEEELPHFHIRYGSESFDALLAMENWAPTYFPAGTSDEAVTEAMSGHGHEEEYDEHVWTSPINAMRITQAISDALCTLDAEHADSYRANCDAYVAKLEELDASFRAVVQNAARRTLIFGDRFPFRYFVDAYGLEYFAAFPGCSTETEASVQTVTFLMDEVKAQQIPVVFHIEFSNEKMADTISEATGAKKLLLHSCHNVTKTQFEAGVSYLELMTQNVAALKEALN